MHTLSTEQLHHEISAINTVCITSDYSAAVVHTGGFPAFQHLILILPPNEEKLPEPILRRSGIRTQPTRTLLFAPLPLHQLPHTDQY